MRRYSIIVRERGATKETELCAVDANPEAVLAGVQAKRLMIDGGGASSRRVAVPQYEHSYIRENKK